MGDEREAAHTDAEGPFAQFAPFPTIVVTGPHRAGTTVAAQMIGRDLERTVIPEEAFGFSNGTHLLRIVVCCRLARLPIVVQAPGLFHHMRFFGRLPGTAVVLMRRPLDDIRASRARMVSRDGTPLSGEDQNAVELRKLGRADGDAAEIKYRLWEEWKPRIGRPFELDYEALAAHPDWVDAQTRRAQGARWHNRRTS